MDNRALWAEATCQAIAEYRAQEACNEGYPPEELPELLKQTEADLRVFKNQCFKMWKASRDKLPPH